MAAKFKLEVEFDWSIRLAAVAAALDLFCNGEESNFIADEDNLFVFLEFFFNNFNLNLSEMMSVSKEAQNNFRVLSQRLKETTAYIDTELKEWEKGEE